LIYFFRNLFLVSPLFLFFACNSDNLQTYSKFEKQMPATFTGNKSCKECHENAFNNWMGSDHERAMDTAITKTVLGDFDNKEFAYKGFKNRFYKKGERFFVYTKGPDGKAGDFEIKYTFGVRPLQQYLIPFEDGKMQCLPIAWDTEKKEWYHLNERVYEGEDIPPNDWLYWTNGGQNWNSMCAECHSTDLQIGYDSETQVFHTTWKEINVSCEACHGPASNHVSWSEIAENKRPEIPHYGFDRKTVELKTEELLDQCAFCHTRRSSLSNYHDEGDNYLNHFMPGLISSNYYYPDGQIKGEDYVFGSFTQSRMHKSHVKCTDCHEPHSLKTKLQGNLLCLQCHDYKNYDTEKHHFHKPTGQGQSSTKTENGFYDQGDGTQCVDCHMTGGIYMGVDFRRDHSIRIPRPDVAKATESPDACTQCHADKTDDWAIKTLKEWYPDTKNTNHYGLAFYQARQGNYNALQGLLDVLEDTGAAVMVKAGALAYLASLPTAEGYLISRPYLHDTLSLLRFAAVQNYFGTASKARVKDLAPLLSDSLKAIRIAAVQNLMSMDNIELDSIQRKSFDAAQNEFLSFLEYSAFFSSSRQNLGIYYLRNNDAINAIKQFKTAIRIDDKYFPAMLNLAQTYSKTGNIYLAEKWLKTILRSDSNNIEALRYMGLLKAEQKNYKEALIYMEKVSKLNPQNDRNYYNLGLVYEYLGQSEKARQPLLKALSLNPENYDYLYALGLNFLSANDNKEAQMMASKIIELYPREKGGYIIQSKIKQ